MSQCHNHGVSKSHSWCENDDLRVNDFLQVCINREKERKRRKERENRLIVFNLLLIVIKIFDISLH